MPRHATKSVASASDARAFGEALQRQGIRAGLAASLSVPWFAYQAVAHGRWFVGSGATAPAQTSQENHILFYVIRLALTDPLMVAGVAAAFPLFLGEIRRRSAGATLLACWLALLAVWVLVWRDRNITYLLPAIPPPFETVGPPVAAFPSTMVRVSLA